MKDGPVSEKRTIFYNRQKPCPQCVRYSETLLYTKTLKHLNCVNGQFHDQSIIKQAYLESRGNYDRDSRRIGNKNEHPRYSGIYPSNVSKPHKHLTLPLPGCCREQHNTNRKISQSLKNSKQSLLLE